MRKVPLAPDVDAKVIARGTPGFSGADLANLVNEAALLAARRNKRMVTQLEFEDSKDKVMMGAERRSMIMTEEEKLATAYHEGGHALVNLKVPGSDPLHKVTIIPRGRALGVTMSLPERDKLSYSKQWCEARIAMSFGGRVRAGHLRQGPSTGAASDICRPPFRRMVTDGHEQLGPLRYNEPAGSLPRRDYNARTCQDRQSSDEESAASSPRGVGTEVIPPTAGSRPSAGAHGVRTSRRGGNTLCAARRSCASPTTTARRTWLAVPTAGSACVRAAPWSPQPQAG
jgi:ATP-dependent Zn protease